MYARVWKRVLDVILSSSALVILSPVLLGLTVTGTIVMGGNPFFTQIRPGKDEKLFRLVKFRSMSNKKDKDGELLPDEKRLTKYGRFIRSTSLDELPELWNILKGDMSIVGPRPQLVRDMVFMTPEQRRRHCVRQGLTGLAQCNGRNTISWENKLKYDLLYIQHISLWGDICILLKTVEGVFKREGITEDNMATAEDLGDHLLQQNVIDLAFYEEKQREAEMLLRQFWNRENRLEV